MNRNILLFSLFIILFNLKHHQACPTKTTRTTSSVEIAKSSTGYFKSLIPLTRTSLSNAMEVELTTKYESTTREACFSRFTITNDKMLDISNSAFKNIVVQAIPYQVSCSNHSECCDKCLKASCTFYLYSHSLHECSMFIKVKAFDAAIKSIDMVNEEGSFIGNKDGP